MLRSVRAELLPAQDYSSGNRLSHATEDQTDRETERGGGCIEIVMGAFEMGDTDRERGYEQ